MKMNHALAMALSALSAGLLISCVKPADENQAAEVDSQEVVLVPATARAMLATHRHLLVIVDSISAPIHLTDRFVLLHRHILESRYPLPHASNMSFGSQD